MGKGHVQIHLLGTSFTIQADEDPAYLSRVVEYLEKKVREIESSVSIKDPLRLAILTGILLADELFKERGGRGSADPDSAEAERMTREIIERIDRSLREEESENASS